MEIYFYTAVPTIYISLIVIHKISYLTLNVTEQNIIQGSCSCLLLFKLAINETYRYLHFILSNSFTNNKVVHTVGCSIVTLQLGMQYSNELSMLEH